MSLLKIEDLSISFGGLKALSDFNLELEKGDIIAIIGPNGAGKTTIFNILSGIYLPDKGNVFLEGKSILGLKPHQVTQRGMTRTFQNIRLFKEQTVLDNVRDALHWHQNYGLIPTFLHTTAYGRGEKTMYETAMELLSLLGLADKKDELAKNLPYGQQRRLEICRALACKPKIILLDEPAAGMNTSETAALMSLILELKDRFGLSILLIEHDMSLVMGISQKIYVLDYGVTIAVGEPKEIQQNPIVIKAYLGEEINSYAPFS